MEVVKAFEDYLKLHSMSKAYVNPVTIFLRFCKKNSFDYLKLTYADFTKFFLDVKQGSKKERSNGYINNFFNALKCFYTFLEVTGKLEEGAKTKSELLKFKYLKVPKKINSVIDLNEVDKYIKLSISFGLSMNYKKLRAILYFMFFTGVRKGELARIKRVDINLADNSAIVRLPNKSQKERIVRFTPRVADILKEYFVIEKEGQSAFNMSYKQIEHLFEFLKKFNKELKPKTMRSSFTEMLAENSVDIKTAQILLGHSDLQTTEIYYRPTDKTVSTVYQSKIK